MQCRSCNNLIKDSSKFCKFCGVAVAPRDPIPPPPISIHPTENTNAMQNIQQTQYTQQRPPYTREYAPQPPQNNKKIIITAIILAVIAIGTAVFFLLRETNDNSPDGTGQPGIEEPNTNGSAGNNENDLLIPPGDSESSGDTDISTPGQQGNQPDNTPGSTTGDSVSVNIEALQMIGRRNSDLIAINGRDAESHVFDGTAWANYTNRQVPHPLLFGMEVEFDAFYDIVTSDYGVLPWDTTNIWPDDSFVASIYLWGEEIKLIFRSDKPITYDVLSELTGMKPQLYFIPEDEQIHDSYGVDVWTSEFQYDCYTFYTTFIMPDNELDVLEMRIWTQT